MRNKFVHIGIMIRKSGTSQLKAEGNETVTNCHGLKMQSDDLKSYKQADKMRNK